MGIDVIQSQRIEVLLHALLQTVEQASDQPLQVLATQHFIVPNQAVEHWLVQRLAEQRGIAANYQFHERLRGFQWYVYQAVLHQEEQREHVRRANIPRLILKWRIYQTLSQFQFESLNPEHPVYPLMLRVQQSAEKLSQKHDQQQKKQRMLYWIAEQVSKLFSHYMTYRASCVANCQGICQCASNWLHAWGEDQALNIPEHLFTTQSEQLDFEVEQLEMLERWQRWLWKNCFHQDFLEIQQIDQLFWTQFSSEESIQQAKACLPEQIVVFTLLDLPPSQLSFLRRLGQYVNILILHYNPSQEYWADSVDPLWKQRYDVKVKERFIQKNPKSNDEQIARFFEQFTLHFNAEVRESRHPLLTRFGKQARDHFSLLASLSTGEEGHWVDAFVDEFPNSLLGKIQSDILHLNEPEPDAYPLDQKDNSIQIHVCHSTQRQLEALRERLIDWLNTPSEITRKPSDILVLVPNLKTIEPLVRSVFLSAASDHDVFLPIKMTGLSPLDVSYAWQALTGRLSLPQGRFSMDDFADWLNLLATQQYYGLDEIGVERMLELLGQAGFKRGLDEQHLAQQLSQDDRDFRYSFKFAIDRLALAIAMPVHGLFNDILGLGEIYPDDFEKIGILIQIYNDLHFRRDWLSQAEFNYSVEDWLKQLEQELIAFETAGVTALAAIREVVNKQKTMFTLARFYQQQAQEAHSAQPSFKLPLDYLLEEIERGLDQQMSKASPSGHISFSEIGQIRPLPYRLIVMLNLDQGSFPKQDQHLPFDLMAKLRPQLGDRSRLDDEQGAFLDALLNAQENFWVFYNGFEVANAEPREPSHVLRELRAHLDLIIKPNDQVPLSSAYQSLALGPKLFTLHQIYPLQPFDIKGFGSELALTRYQDQWYGVAKALTGIDNYRHAWTHQLNAPELSQEALILESNQWIREISFPAKLYLNHLGVENLVLSGELDQDEPLFLNGLGKYTLRESLLEHSTQPDPKQLLDQLPIGKISQSTWQQSCFESEQLHQRLLAYADQATSTTQQRLKINDQLQLWVSAPENDSLLWVNVNPASARGKRFAEIWLEYLLWLQVTQNSEPEKLRRVVIFPDKTVICEGLTREHALALLTVWVEAWQQAKTAPLALPAALMLKPLESLKTYEWEVNAAGHMLLTEADQAKVLALWSQRYSYGGLDARLDESSQFHQDWAFILQNKDPDAALVQALAQFGHALYAPIFAGMQVMEN